MKRIAAVVLLGGCSALFVDGPKGWTPRSGRAPSCDTDATAPVVGDVVLGLVGTTLVGFGFVPFPCESARCYAPHADLLVVGGALLVGSIASIATGVSRARQCRSAMFEYERLPASDH